VQYRPILGDVAGDRQLIRFVFVLVFSPGRIGPLVGGSSHFCRKFEEEVIRRGTHLQVSRFDACGCWDTKADLAHQAIGAD
jgi:hypothetical protein